MKQDYICISDVRDDYGVTSWEVQAKTKWKPSQSRKHSIMNCLLMETVPSLQLREQYKKVKSRRCNQTDFDHSIGGQMLLHEVKCGKLAWIDF